MPTPGHAASSSLITKAFLCCVERTLPPRRGFSKRQNVGNSLYKIGRASLATNLNRGSVSLITRSMPLKGAAFSTLMSPSMSNYA
jgi:hypothetical protein